MEKQTMGTSNIADNVVVITGASSGIGEKHGKASRPARSGAAKLVGVLAGESPARGTCPVAPVVISGGGAGDQSAGSPEVKVLVGWVKTWSAPTGGQANRQVVRQANGREAPKLRALTRIGV